MEKFRANKNWIDLWNSVPVLQKPRALELAKKFKSVNKNWSQKGVATTHIVYFIIFENFGKVSAFVVRKLRLLKVLGSRALGLCCRSLRFYNNCKLSYLKNKNYFCLLFDFCKQGKVEAAAALVFQIQNFCPALCLSIGQPTVIWISDVHPKFKYNFPAVWYDTIFSKPKYLLCKIRQNGNCRANEVYKSVVSHLFRKSFLALNWRNVLTEWELKQRMTNVLY